MAAIPPVCDFDWQAPAFALPATDGKTYALADIRGPNGTLVMFICNHCPYVLAVLDRMLRDARDLQIGKHTSELQSHLNLVCRLLLEKKNNSTL